MTLCHAAMGAGVYSQDWPAMCLALLGKTCITFSFGVLYLYCNELLPTEIRASATGSASFVGENFLLYLRHIFPRLSRKIHGILTVWEFSTEDYQKAIAICSAATLYTYAHAEPNPVLFHDHVWLC